MSPATQELQRASLQLADLAATQERAKMRTTCRHCGLTIVRWDDPNAERAYGRSPLFVHDDRVDVDCTGIECDSEGESFAEPVPHPDRRDDEELFACLTCEDTGEVEVQQRDGYGHAYRAPWATETVPCPDCEGSGR